MPKSSLKAKYDTGSNLATASAFIALQDVRLKASCTTDSVRSGGKLTGVSVGVDRPGVFSIDYDLDSKAAKFQFHSSASVASKPVKLTYNHNNKNQTATIESVVILDAKNKITGKYNLKTEKPHLKYSYIHGGDTILEPAYDFEKDAWAFGMTHKASITDTYKGNYNSATKKISLEWQRNPVDTGAFRIEAILPTEKGTKGPSLIIEKMWNFNL